MIAVAGFTVVLSVTQALFSATGTASMCTVRSIDLSGPAVSRNYAARIDGVVGANSQGSLISSMRISLRAW
jgi:hypothetical protein